MSAPLTHIKKAQEEQDTKDRDIVTRLVNNSCNALINGLYAKDQHNGVKTVSITPITDAECCYEALWRQSIMERFKTQSDFKLVFADVMIDGAIQKYFRVQVVCCS